MFHDFSSPRMPALYRLTIAPPGLIRAKRVPSIPFGELGCDFKGRTITRPERWTTGEFRNAPPRFVIGAPPAHSSAFVDAALTRALSIAAALLWSMILSVLV